MDTGVCQKGDRSLDEESKCSGGTVPGTGRLDCRLLEEAADSDVVLDL